MTDSFANHPPSISELRSDKTECAADWTPRDALISTLRRIDSGELKVEALVIAMRRAPEVGAERGQLSYAVASPDHFITVGLLHATLFCLQHAQDS